MFLEFFSNLGAQLVPIVSVFCIVCSSFLILPTLTSMYVSESVSLLSVSIPREQVNTHISCVCNRYC